MSDGMTHEAAREALDALALDALDASERETVMAHVAGCVACQDELASLEHTVGDLAFAAAPLPMPPAQRARVRARLLARAAADRDASRGVTGAADAGNAMPPVDVPTRSADVRPIRPAAAAPATVPSPIIARRTRGAATWMAMAASIVAVLGVGAFLKARSERDEFREALATASVERGARKVALDSLEAVVADRDRMIANLTGPQVAVMTLASAGPQSPTGRMFWDQQHDAWTFVAHNVPAPAPGRIYQLWLVTPTAKISAGTFRPSAGGDVVVRATYALAKDSLAAVAVTDEPGRGSPQPTTVPFLVASK